MNAAVLIVIDSAVRDADTFLLCLKSLKPARRKFEKAFNMYGNMSIKRQEQNNQTTESCSARAVDLF